MLFRWSITERTILVDVEGIGSVSELSSTWSSYSIPSFEVEEPDLTVEFRSDLFLANRSLSPSEWLRRTGDRCQYAIDMKNYYVPGFFYKRADRYRGRFLAIEENAELLKGAIKSCFSFICEDRNSLLLHASAVLRNGRVWVFCGPSGSGKTTIATELNDCGQAFSVDSVVLSIDKDGVVRADSTPFGEDGENVPRRTAIPVAGIALIEQSDHDEVVTRESSRTISELLAQSLGFHFRGPERIARNLNIVGSVFDNTRCFWLKFSRSNAFWRLLDEMPDLPITRS